MKLNVEKTAVGYTIIDGTSKKVLKEGLSVSGVYTHMLVPQVQATIAAIGRLIEKADAAFQPPSSDSSQGDFDELIDLELSDDP